MHVVGYIAELISQTSQGCLANLRANCLLHRQWKQERSCVKCFLSGWMPEVSQRIVHQEDGSCTWIAAQQTVLYGSATSSMLSRVQVYDILPPPFCCSFPPGSRL